MPVKCTGAQFKAFYNDDSIWPTDAWTEDAEIKVDGAVTDDTYDLGSVADDALIVVEGGIVLGVSETIDPSLEQYLKKWLKVQSTVSMVVEVDRSKEEALRVAIKAAGGKILK